MPLKAVALNATAVPGRAPYAIFGATFVRGTFCKPLNRKFLREWCSDLGARVWGAGRSPARDVVPREVGSGSRAEGDLVAERLQLADEAAGLAIVVDAQFVEVRTEVDKARCRVRE